MKEKTVHASSCFSFGWSHGKEKLEGKPDYSKVMESTTLSTVIDTIQGSYYNNPVYDRPFDDENIIKEHPTFAHPNIWPHENLPELRDAFMQLGTLIVEVCDDGIQHHHST